MAIWKDQPSSKSTPAPSTPEPAAFRDSEVAEINRANGSPSQASNRDTHESLIASDLSIEGKIEGTGHVRIAGKFKGDVNVQGNLTIEKGAKLSGGVRADKVIIAGELEGNIEAAQKVELLESGVLNGDLKAGSLTVSAGSKMRGQVEFGWEGKTTPKPVAKVETSRVENGSAS